jgi:hypothetical protein
LGQAIAVAELMQISQHPVVVDIDARRLGQTGKPSQGLGTSSAVMQSMATAYGLFNSHHPRVEHRPALSI